MQDLMPPINTPDSAFHDGDPTTGQLGTIVTALWLNNVQSATRDVQLEIKNVLAKAGIQPDPKKTNQLAEAISQIIGSGNYASTAYVDNGLNKKIDKASISGQKGNDNDKVPSLNLFTTEIGKLAAIGYSYSKIESDGKYQPKGNYAPAGDYATNAALNNGLALKFDKTGGIITASGQAIALQNTDNNQSHSIGFLDSSGNRRGLIGYTNATNDFVLSNTRSGITLKLTAGGKALIGDKEIARAGDYGIGANVITSNNWDLINKTGIYTNSSSEQPELPVRAGYLCLIHMQTWVNATQVCFRASALLPLTYRRSFDNGSWGEWKVDYNEANTKADRNGYLKVSGISDDLSDYPVGAPIPWPQTAAPSGFLVCNGQSFNKTTYPLLAKAYPIGVLPDLRAEFIRGLDAGRNIDSARAVLSAQGDAIRDITGKIQGVNMVGDGAFGNRTLIFNEASPHGGGKDQYGMTFKASNVVPTANENRPRNIAFLYIVRAA